MTEENNNERALRKQIEAVAGRTMQTARDFDILAESIFEKTRQSVSVSTLKRLYGYVSSDGGQRRATLDILSQYVGYQSWAAFCHRTASAGGLESTPLLSESLSADEICVDDRLRVMWQPDHECVFRCIGHHRFAVESSVGSKLSVGDTFRCHLFIKGEALYLEDVVMQGAAPVNYVCGNKHGILFILMQ
ncbi:MAG: hypothetical protein MJZ54_00495 [Bacteroidaceae bacterium]|nr:hypothetical protein [Bacteroidaceae bacterium]